MDIGFLGCGKLGKAILRGLQKSELWKQHTFSASVTREESAQKLKEEFRIQTFLENQSLYNHAQMIVLAAKPFQIAGIISQLKLDKKPRTWISLCAGLPYATLRGLFPKQEIVVRAMPSTSASLGESMTLLYGESQDPTTQNLFSNVGETLWVDADEKIDLLTPLTASSPAFFYHLTEGMEEYLAPLNLSAKERSLLIGQTLKGVAEKILTEGKSSEDLIKEVATPGGMTVAGLRKLTEFQSRESMKTALEAALARQKELSKPF